MNSGHVHTAWPCLRLAEGVALRLRMEDGYNEARRGDEVVPWEEAWVTCDPHGTREEAERHYYDASLAEASEYMVSWRACAIPECPNPTQRSLGNRGFDRHFQVVPLCDEHRTREQLAALYPFTPGMAFIHS